MRLYSFICVGIVTVSCVYFHQETEMSYTEKYRLDFDLSKQHQEGVYPWLQNPAYSFSAVPDVEEEGHGRMLLRFHGVEGIPLQEMNPFKMDLYQKILMPHTTGKYGKVQLECKGAFLRRVALVVGGETAQEERIFQDTLIFIPDSLMGKYSIAFPVRDVDLLSIRVYAEGIPMESSSLTLSCCDISIDDKSIDDFAMRRLPPLDTRDYVVKMLSTEGGGDSVFSINSSKMVGLCESVHRNRGIQRLEADLLLEQVWLGRTRLVLIERSLESSLVYNHYIHHAEMELDSILFYDTPNPFLLEGLRAFNAGKAAEDQVSLLGIDYEYKRFGSYDALGNTLFDFLIWVNRDKQNIVVNRLALKIMQQAWRQAQTLLAQEREEVLQVLDNEEYDCLAYILNDVQRMPEDWIGGSVVRDSIMFERVCYLGSRFGQNSERIFLCGQASHLNLCSAYPNPMDVLPLGVRLREKYGNGYSCYGLLVAGGSALRYGQDFTVRDEALQQEPEESLEYVLRKEKRSPLYVPLTPELNRLVLTRWEGLFQLKQEFYPMNLHSRYHGVFFVYDTLQAIKMGNMDMMQRDMDRLNYRNKIWNEMQGGKFK